jgi:rod shape determining protein RodA
LIVPILLTAVPFLLIMLQPDLGTALMLGFIFMSMTIFVKLRLSVYVILGSSGLGAVFLAWEHLLRPYQKQRIRTFLDPEADPMGHGYQIMQSKLRGTCISCRNGTPISPLPSGVRSGVFSVRCFSSAPIS